jgi:hypothetical protein
MVVCEQTEVGCLMVLQWFWQQWAVVCACIHVVVAGEWGCQLGSSLFMALLCHCMGPVSTATHGHGLAWTAVQVLARASLTSSTVRSLHVRTHHLVPRVDTGGSETCGAKNWVHELTRECACVGMTSKNANTVLARVWR